MATDILILVFCFVLLAATEARRYRNSPRCSWCGTRHYGRCIRNPRSGRLFANVNDGHFDYNDPNK